MRAWQPALVAAQALLCAACAVQAQGDDSSPAERHLLLLAELLPGHYSNANQVYFDGRRGRPG